jgi:hypothetical protein
MTARHLTVRGRRYPLVLPNIRDPRLHVAAVIISVHVLGQVALHFHVSVPQILAAMAASAVLEVALTFRQSRTIVWPASAMLTGSGVALILRVVGTPADQPWFTGSWELYAVVGGLSLLTKYVIRYRGSHVFNPSNIGLVAAFVLLGSSRVQPLDFWWAPLNPAMIAAYVVILGGGLLITRRLHLLELAGSFWVAFAAGLGLLSISGHCMTANWAFAPVCGSDFWRTVVFSPEVMVFLFFMITDPKTVPTGRVGRIAFGVILALVATLLIAPQTDEFGTKVALLSSLVIMCAGRYLLERFVPQTSSTADTPGRFARRLLGGPHATPARPVAFLRVGSAGALVLAVGLAIVLAGLPARGVPIGSNVLAIEPSEIDPSTLPPIALAPDVTDFDHELAGAGIQAVVVTLAQNLELENQALLKRDPTILPTVDHGARLDEMRSRVASAVATGSVVISHYRFESIAAALLVPFGEQTGLSLGLAAQGTLTEETYDGAGTLVTSSERPFHATFAVRRATGARWLNVAVLP